jgi:hypothetical protein
MSLLLLQVIVLLAILSLFNSNHILVTALSSPHSDTSIIGIKEVSYVVRAGKPVDEIISLLAERYFDLIVMGSNRISSTMGVILGSNVRRVLNKVQRSVLIIQ